MLDFSVDTLDAVPESARKFYAASNGKFVLDEGIAENIKGLKSALDKEKAAAVGNEQATREAKAAKEELETLRAKYAGLDPVKAKEFMAKFENDEEAQLIAAGKIHDVIAKRTEKERMEWKRQQDEKDTEIATAKAMAESYKDRVLENAIMAAAVKAGLNKQGIRDSMFLAKTVFTLDENGKEVQRNADGSIVIGRDGKTPFNADEWYESQRPESPNWYNVSSSGSSPTGKPGVAGGKQMKRASFDALSPQGKAETIKSGIQIID